MFFIGTRTSGDLSLTTPLERCCNCGARGPIELVETPLQRTRYFLFFGTELTLNETFPYCRRCMGSAKRIRLGWLSKILSACLVTAAVFLVLVLAAPSLPAMLSANLFRSSVAIAVVLTLAYFYILEWGRTGSTYYQPVSLVDADVSGDSLSELKLKFYNPAYARIFTQANPELIAAGVLKVEVEGNNAMKSRYGSSSPLA